MVPNKFVIDTDCLNFLLNNFIGKEILESIEILLPPSIYEELGSKERRDLDNLNVKIIELDYKDKNFAGDIIWKLNGSKEYKISYLKNRKIHHRGECEAAAIARKEKCPLVIRERKANSIIKKVLKHSPISVISIVEFGKTVLKNKDLDHYMEEFLESLFEEYLIQ